MKIPLDDTVAGLLHEALGESPADASITPLAGGNSGVLVARVQGTTSGGEAYSVVLKSRTDSRPHAALWYSDDPGVLDREYHVYAILERFGLPHANVLARGHVGAGSWALVLEDLAQRYLLPGSEYAFTALDKSSIISTYALIHTRTMGTDCQAANIQPDEGSEVTQDVAEDMLSVLDGYEIDGAKLAPEDFRNSLSVLLECRKDWANEPRCLLYGDFHQTNVALPKDSAGAAVLFDWELARYGLPQFDALNAGFADDAGLAQYAQRIEANGGRIDIRRFKAGLHYAELSAVFYTLWLLHKKLQRDPSGKLPRWMRNLTADLFAGGLVARARKVQW